MFTLNLVNIKLKKNLPWSYSLQVSLTYLIGLEIPELKEEDMPMVWLYISLNYYMLLVTERK